MRSCDPPFGVWAEVGAASGDRETHVASMVRYSCGASNIN
jgi:hypothetical protein